jgi:hypothetical protein
MDQHQEFTLEEEEAEDLAEVQVDQAEVAQEEVILDQVQHQ